MIDAVDSGGYGVLGLYAARPPVVPDPPVSPPAVNTASGSAADAAQAVQATPPIQGQGSGPVAPAEPGADGSASQGRDFGDSAKGQARQAGVLAALATAGGTYQSAGTGASGAASVSAPPTARALRAYDRAGASVPAGGASGIMMARRA